MATSPSHVAARARQAARGDGLEALARAGYAVKGVLYALVGVFALLAALGEGSRPTGAEGALRAVAGTRFGGVLLGVIAAGLVGYALWRFVQAALDPERRGSDAKGIAQRLGFVGSGVVYAGLALSALRLLLGHGGAGRGDPAHTWTARLMSQPFGPWLVGLAGVVGVGLGLYHLRRAWTASFAKRLGTASMSGEAEAWVLRLSRFGIGARAVVFVLAGVFLFGAAFQADPREARGLDGVLQALREQPAGPFLLGVVALGLVAYGAYCLVAARYRRFG